MLRGEENIFENNGQHHNYQTEQSSVMDMQSYQPLVFMNLSTGMVAQRLSDAELKKELSTVWPNLSQKTMDLLVTPHKRKHIMNHHPGDSFLLLP